jgi:hypothetical protein
MSELITIAKEALKKSRLERKAKLLKEETKEEKSKFLEVETRGEKQVVPPPVEDFETFAKKLFACQ